MYSNISRTSVRTIAMHLGNLNTKLYYSKQVKDNRFVRVTIVIRSWQICNKYAHDDKTTDYTVTVFTHDRRFFYEILYVPKSKVEIIIWPSLTTPGKIQHSVHSLCLYFISATWTPGVLFDNVTTCKYKINLQGHAQKTQGRIDQTPSSKPLE